MITLVIDLKYKRKAGDSEKLTNADLTYDYVTHAVNERYRSENGIKDKTKRRIFARIQEKFDKAIEDKAESINLENAELDFIKDAFKETTFPAAVSKYVVLLEDQLEKLEVVKEEKE